MVQTDISDNLCAEESIEINGRHQFPCSIDGNAFPNATLNADLNAVYEIECRDVQYMADETADAADMAPLVSVQVPASPGLPNSEVLSCSDDRELEMNEESHLCSMCGHQRGGEAAYGGCTPTAANADATSPPPPSPQQHNHPEAYGICTETTAEYS